MDMVDNMRYGTRAQQLWILPRLRMVMMPKQNTATSTNGTEWREGELESERSARAMRLCCVWVSRSFSLCLSMLFAFVYALRMPVLAVVMCVCVCGRVRPQRFVYM